MRERGAAERNYADPRKCRGLKLSRLFAWSHFQRRRAARTARSRRAAGNAPKGSHVFNADPSLADHGREVRAVSAAAAERWHRRAVPSAFWRGLTPRPRRSQQKEITLLRDAIEKERQDKMKLLSELEMYRSKLKRILRAVHRQRQARDGQGEQETRSPAPPPAAPAAGATREAQDCEEVEASPRRRQRVAGTSRLWNERDGGLAPRVETAGGTEAAGEQSQRYWGSSVVATQEASTPLRLPRRT